MSITSVVSLSAGKIGELLIEEAKLLYGVEDRIKSLQYELTMMQSFLVDMEAMDEEGSDERSRTTIKQIREIAYDAEDVIESYILENSYSTNKMEDFLQRYVCFYSSIVHTHQFGSEIKAIIASIGDTIDRCKRFGIIRSDDRQGLNKSNRLGGVRPVAYPHTIEDHVVGLDEDINKLIKVLISDDENIEVVLFVGMGGSGKTTLARKLYNHEAIVKHFDYVAWVSISQKLAVEQILIDLLKKVGRGSIRTDEFSSSGLVEKLHQCLESKRFLIVLDDVWTKEALEQILPAFPLKSNGRKVIVTTRNQNVANFSDVKSFIHEPKRLNDEESWELFRKIALIHRGSLDEIPLLEDLGKEMLKKCKGLPLAVIALAGILGKKETVEDWEKMKKAVSSRIMEDGCGTHLYGPVNEMLMLSYYDLPPHLKPCFLYLAMFPEDYEIPIGQLIRMWIAEGFIKLHEGYTLEDVARTYLDELIHRCVVQIAKKVYQGKVSKIQVHDLVRDICIKRANEEDFLHIFSSESQNSEIMATESRRVAIYSSNGINSPFPTRSQHLRSLIYDGLPEIQPSLRLLLNEDFRLLRVLILQSVTISDGTLPAGIGNLIHLRYLRLFDTNITKLSSSIGNLRKLITLDYRQLQSTDLNTNSDLRIPDVIWKIEGLRHLYLPMSGTMKQPLKFHTLKHLHTLFGMQGGDWMLKQLPGLSQNVRKLNIRDIKSVKHLEAAFECPSIRLDLLHSLELRWASMASDSQQKHSLIVKQEILEPIIHSQHLSKLKLFGRMRDGLQGGSTQWPTSLSTLWLIESGFEAEATLIAIANLPRLSYLFLSVSSYMGIRWTCYAGQFPWLIELNLVGVPNLEEWRIERGTMPQLLRLGLMDCKKLKRIPEGLKFITTLQILRLTRMSDEFNKRARGEDAHIIQHVPLVYFN